MRYELHLVERDLVAFGQASIASGEMAYTMRWADSVDFDGE